MKLVQTPKSRELTGEGSLEDGLDGVWIIGDVENIHHSTTNEDDWYHLVSSARCWTRWNSRGADRM